MSLLKSLFVLSCVLAASVSVCAQSTQQPNDKPNVFLQREPKVDKSRLRDLKGIVKDELNNPIDGAIIQLKDLKSGKIVDFRTKEDGKFLFYDLNMDLDYEVRVLKDGFEAQPIKKLTRFDTRKPATMIFELQRKAS